MATRIGPSTDLSRRTAEWLSLPGRIRGRWGSADDLSMPTTSAGTPPTRVMEWLADGLPLALLVDLFLGDRLDSSEVMRREGASLRSIGLPRWPHPAA
ncbi:MAG: hypothetical protein QOE64_1249 [Frankiales bacterium]|nr:hypothetical protein [Frankiales bacterium]